MTVYRLFGALFGSSKSENRLHEVDETSVRGPAPQSNGSREAWSKEYHLEVALLMRNSLGLADGQIDLDALVIAGLEKEYWFAKKRSRLDTPDLKDHVGVKRGFSWLLYKE